MSDLIFVRHGQASFGEESYDKLSATGLQQVSLLARHWQSLGERFDHLYCGNLQRQQETAEALAPLVTGETRIHGGFDEYNGSPLIEMYLRDHARQGAVGEGLSLPILDRRLFQQVFEAATSKWISDELIPTEADAEFEAWPAFRQRVGSAMTELMERHRNGSRVLISTSGGVIALVLQKVLDLSDAQTIALNWMVNNSSVTRIRYGGGRISLGLFNGLSHLEGPEYRELITFR